MSEELLEEFEDEQDTQKGMFMTFQMGEECYGIAVTFVQEIVGIQPITAVPEIEDYIKGLINIRGKIIPVIDVRVRFKQEPFEYTDRTCIIVINVKSTIIGLIVDKIAGVITVDEREIILPPSLSQSGSVSSKYVFGLAKVDDEVKLLLDPERLIRDEDIAAFGEAVPSTEVSEEA